MKDRAKHSSAKKILYCKIIQFFCRIALGVMLIINFEWGFCCTLKYYDSFDEYIGAIAPVQIVTIIVGLVVYVVHARTMRMLIALDE